MQIDSDVLIKWIEYRTAQLKHDVEAAKANPGTLSGGLLIKVAEARKRAEGFVSEMTLLAEWMVDGAPEFVPPLTEVERKAWIFARDHGAEIPEHIAKQL